MSFCDSLGQQLDTDDLYGVPWLDDDNAVIVVHYGNTATGRVTVGVAAERLGMTPDDYRRGLRELVTCGALIPRGDGEYDAEAAE